MLVSAGRCGQEACLPTFLVCTHNTPPCTHAHSRTHTRKSPSRRGKTTKLPTLDRETPSIRYASGMRQLDAQSRGVQRSARHRTACSANTTQARGRTVKPSITFARPSREVISFSSVDSERKISLELHFACVCTRAHQHVRLAVMAHHAKKGAM
jgi:hypothetical protein